MQFCAWLSGLVIVEENYLPFSVKPFVLKIIAHSNNMYNAEKINYISFCIQNVIVHSLQPNFMDLPQQI